MHIRGDLHICTPAPTFTTAFFYLFMSLCRFDWRPRGGKEPAAALHRVHFPSWYLHLGQRCCTQTAFFFCCCFSLLRSKCVTLVGDRNQRRGPHCCSHEGQVNSGAKHVFATATTTASVVFSTAFVDMRVDALFRCGAGTGAGRRCARFGRPWHMLHRRVRQDGGGRSHCALKKTTGFALYSRSMDVSWFSVCV